VEFKFIFQQLENPEVSETDYFYLVKEILIEKQKKRVKILQNGGKKTQKV